jgi:hypothetical protein
VQWWVAFSEIVRNLAIVLGGAIGIYLGWKRVAAATRQADAQLRQTELTRRSHVAELFNRAVGQLKDEKLEVRLGAIFTLGQLCKDFSDLSEPVIQLLTTYLRENAVDYGGAEPPVDAREINAILRDRLEEKR